MATLKGQNVRILKYTSGGHFAVYAKATSCTVTMTGNTEDASHKDIVGNAALPTIVSKSWQVQLESLEVTDMYGILSSILNSEKLTIRFDETATSNNQTQQNAAYSRHGECYISDVTFNFNDRENSTKSLTLMGTGALGKDTTAPTTDDITPSTAFTKGQFVRLFLGSDNTAVPDSVIAYARQMAFHVSVQMEQATTKDTTGDWQIQEPVGYSYDITSSALVRSGDSITSTVAGKTLADIEDIYEASAPVRFIIANTVGPNNRIIQSQIVKGSVVITNLQLTAANRQSAEYQTTLNGFGDYELGNPPT